ncbi:hypothetical protein TNCV_286051 [Trichonephila clavipes]|nr:hypothetical protein TNCV_286051 [Trichonephila clavipes]
MYKRKSKTPPKGEKNTKMLAKGERAYSLVDERQRGKRRLRQEEKLNFRCRKGRETRPLCVEAEPELTSISSIQLEKETGQTRQRVSSHQQSHFGFGEPRRGVKFCVVLSTRYTSEPLAPKSHIYDVSFNGSHCDTC